MRRQTARDRLYRGAAVDSEDSWARPEARRPDRTRGSWATGRSDGRVASHLVQMGPAPGVCLATRPVAEKSRGSKHVVYSSYPLVIIDLKNGGP